MDGERPRYINRNRARKEKKKAWREDRWASPSILAAMEAAEQEAKAKKEGRLTFHRQTVLEMRAISRATTEAKIKAEILNELAQKRQQRKQVIAKSAEAFYSSSAWREVRYQALVLSDGRCQCCGHSSKHGARLHVDHIKPRSLYPDLALDIKNLQVLCDDCNIGKSNKDATDWRYCQEAIHRVVSDVTEDQS